MDNVEEIVGAQQRIENKIIVCIDGDDWIRDLNDIELNFDATEDEILSTIRPMIQEEKGVDIFGTGDSPLYKTRKSTESQNIHVIPNSTAGIK